MTRAELANLVGTTPKQLTKYEEGLQVPRTLELLVDIALLLEVRVDDLFSPAWMKARRARIQNRLIGSYDSSQAEPDTTSALRYVAIASYAGLIVAVIVTPKAVTLLGRYRPRQADATPVTLRVLNKVHSVCIDQRVDAIILEPTSPLLPDIEDKGLAPIKQVTFQTAKQELMPLVTRPTNAALYRFVVTVHPGLHCLARNRVGVFDAASLQVHNQWRMCVLRATALALAVMKRDHIELFQSLCNH